MRVIIYARVSSQKQLDNKEEDSIKSQTHCCRKFSKEMYRIRERWDIVEIISDDGRTGRNDKRDGINRVRTLVSQGKADVVLVYGLSRAFRNSRLGHEFDQALAEHGVRLVSTTQPGGTDTSYEIFVRSIFWALAELTSNIISEDVRRSILSRLQEDLTHGGVPKPGYGIEKGRLYIVPEDAKVVLQIFEMVIQGMTPMEIVNDLNVRKIRTRTRVSNKGKVTGGKRFRIENVLTLLRDPIYKGVLIHDAEEFPSAAESIVSDEIWDKAQVALDSRPRKEEVITQKRDKNFLPLKGLIRCGCCNSAMKPSFSTKRKSDGSMQKYFYYLCSKHEKQGDESTCDIGRVPARLMESLLMEAFGEIAANPEVATRLVESAPKVKTTKIRGLSKERQAIRRQLKDLDTAVDKVVEKVLQLTGTAVGEKLQEKIEALTVEKNDLVAEEIRLNREVDILKSDVLTTEQFQNALSHFAEAVKCLPEDEQRELYRLLFKSIIVRDGGKAKDPINENARRNRDSRRHLSVEVRLRTEAIHTLFGEEHPSAGRKSGFTIPLEIAHCRKKPTENCAILSPVHKECGHKAPKTRKRPKKTEHEIHRAIRWKKEMEELSIGQNEFARSKALSNGAVSHVLKWLELSEGAQILISSLRQPTEIRSVSRSFRKQLIELSPAKQIKAIETRIKSA
ncbi:MULTISPECIES: recombinase family protein [unclassified Lentimonas]|uniref:recombinase family protein n=1 Tax=unclassified Lentimonas TaxID=2630993 RepID=UPI00132AD43D|nr:MULTISPECIES: recombinase family protein [unclassified Lentimonas]CAA6679290.1 Unannotated [Lentimonas sp. CC4]CAA6686325.1 Unannotated [Lentimonas sp. CC6]CAA7076101.1 Unannotated [Lentimonas sp. CC4]CAA7170907.1 Unannotated [Lentimonas sp. CC21]CAA7181151.1 Unannotated [Lentimonas sp. CC8]